jgi:TolB-like protein
MRFALFVMCAVFAAMGQTLAIAKDTQLVMVTEVMDGSQRSIVGELMSETDTEVVLLNIKDGSEFHASKKSLKKFEKNITDEAAIRIVGLPPVVAWRVAKIGKQTNPIGKVANVAQNVIYVTLGTEKGMSVGQKLNVFRKGNEILDPDTNKVLAVERSKIGTLEVTETNKDFSKAKSIGELEVALQKGDEVEAQRPEFQVAVLPFQSENGEVDDASSDLAENLTTQLAQQEIPVLERGVLDRVVVELALQNTILFEPENVQKLGQLAGASVIVTGKIVVKGKTATAYARLIDVRSGKILYAASNSIVLTNTRGSEPSGNLNTAEKTKSGKPAPKSSQPPSKTTQPVSKGSPPQPKVFRSKVIELTDEAPSAWMLKEARVGLRIWPDKEYAWAALPKEIEGGSAVWRDTGYEGWVKTGTVTALNDCTMYALVRWKYLDKVEIDEVTFNQFAKDGWEEVDGNVKCTFPGGEDWRWKALRKDVKRGQVIFQLDHVNFGRRAVQFIFK